MINKHRNEFAVEVGGTTYVVRPTLDLMEKFEERYGILLTCVVGKTLSHRYRMAAFILANATPSVDEAEAAQLVYLDGLAKANAIIEAFIANSCSVPEETKVSVKGKKKA